MAIYFAVAFGTGGASLSMIRRSVKRGAPASSAERASEGADRQ
jgi:putative peptidoglycan lipid II flippase